MDAKTINRIRSYYIGHRMYSELNGFDVGLRLFADNEQKKQNFWQKHKGKIIAAAALAGLGGLAYANKDKINNAISSWRIRNTIPSDLGTVPVISEVSTTGKTKPVKEEDAEQARPSQGSGSKPANGGQGGTKPPAQSAQDTSVSTQGATGAEPPAQSAQDTESKISLGDYPDGKGPDHVLHLLNKIMGGDMAAEKRKCKKYCDMVTRYVTSDSWGGDTTKYIQDLGKVASGLSHAVGILKEAERMAGREKSKHYQHLWIMLSEEIDVIHRFVSLASIPAGTHF